MFAGSESSGGAARRWSLLGLFFRIRIFNLSFDLAAGGTHHA